MPELRRPRSTATATVSPSPPGSAIEFKVSSEEAGTYRADIVRLIHGDTNPAGPGFKEEVARDRGERRLPGALPGRPTAAPASSSTTAGRSRSTARSRSMRSSCRPRPASPARGSWAATRPDSRSGYALVVEDGGAGASASAGDTRQVSGAPFHPWCWYSVAATFTTVPAPSRSTRRSVVNSRQQPALADRPDPRRGLRRGSRVGRPGDSGTSFTIAGLATEPAARAGSTRT